MQISGKQAAFRIRAFFGSGSDFFPESGYGSGSAKNPNLIRKIRIREKKPPKNRSTSSIFFSLHTYLALLTLSFLVRLLCNLVHASSDCECYAAGWAQAAAGGVRHLRGHADQVQELAAAVTAGRTRAGQAHEDWHQSHQASNTSHGEHFSLTFIDHGIGNEFFSFLRNWLFRM